MNRLIAGASLAALLLLSASPVLAGEPDPGHADLFQHDPGDRRLTLDWHFASLSYPAWFRGAVESELETSWQDPVANNSDVPRFDNGGDNAGGGTLVSTSQATSPCTGSPNWIACNPVGGIRGFTINVRSLPSISAPTWLWYQRDNTCSDVYDGDPKPDDGFRTSVCFSVQRVVAHEATHLTLLRPHYEDGLDGETIMQSNTPTPNGSPANWNRRAFLPCDAAAAELEYGAADPAGKLADCFKVTPGDGTKGLDPAMTLDTPAALTRCSNVATTVSGRLALADTAAYEDLRDMPLAGRVVRIDRRPAQRDDMDDGRLHCDRRRGRGDQLVEGDHDDLGGQLRLSSNVLDERVRDRASTAQLGHLDDQLDDDRMSIVRRGERSPAGRRPPAGRWPRPGLLVLAVVLASGCLAPRPSPSESAVSDGSPLRVGFGGAVRSAIRERRPAEHEPGTGGER